MAGKKRIAWLLTFALLLPTLTLTVSGASSKAPTNNFSSVVYDEITNPAALPYGSWQIGANTDNVVYLSDVDWDDYLCTNEKAPFRNAPYNGTEGEGVTLSQTLLYEKGIGMHPASADTAGYLIIDISSYTECDTLYAAVGVNNEASNGVWFEIQVEKKLGGFYSYYSTIACSDLMTPYNVGEFNVDISGYDKIKLVVTAENGINACGSVWADLCIFKKDANAQKPDLSQSEKSQGILLSNEANASAVTNTSVTLSAENSYTIVYNSALDDQINDLKTNVTLQNGQPTYGINYDYEVDLAYSLQDALAKKGISATVTSDASTPVENEILIGYTNRTESSSYLLYLQQNGKLNAYGAAAIGNRIVLGGWGTVANVAAVNWLLAQINASLTLSLGPNSIHTTENAVTIPAYETAGACAGISESAYNELLYYYRGTSVAEFTAYTQKLSDLDYTEQIAYRNSTASNTQGESNEYRLFVNSNEDIQIYLYYSPDEAATRIIAGKAREIHYPTSVQTDTDLVPVSITQMQLDYTTNAGGMCYVVTLKDGSFLIIDSGSTSNANKDHVRLWNLLNQLNVRPDGEIIIRGWFITHEHADHMEVFLKFCNAYGNKVTIEGYYECVVPQTVAYNAKNPAYYHANGSVQAALEQTGGNTKIYMLHTGMNFSLYGVDIDVLYTHEDLYPSNLYYFNNASTAFRLTVNDGEGNSTRVFITGDIFIDACNTLLKRHAAAELSCDILQVAHHGNQGATKAFYQAVDPTVTLWPCSEQNYSAFMDTNGKTAYHTIDQFLVNDLHVTEIYLAGTSDTETVNNGYSVRLTLPYTPNTSERLNVSTEDGHSGMLSGKDYSTTYFASPTVVPAFPYQGEVFYLSDLTYTGTTSGGSTPAQNAPYKGTANTGITAKGGLSFTKGFGTHPKAPGSTDPSYIEIDVSAYTVNQFYALLTLTTDATGVNPIKGQVWADYGNGYVLLLETTPVSGSDLVEIRITNKLEGAKTLKLITISAGESNQSSHTAWCNAAIFQAPYLSENTDYLLNALSAPTKTPNLPYQGAVTYLSDIPYTGTTSNASYTPAQNAPYKGTANSGITTKGSLKFAKGFGTHPKAAGNTAPSYTEIDVSAQSFNRFYSVLSLTSSANGENGIKGQVWADFGNGYVLLLETDAIRSTDMVEIHITDLVGVKKLKLVTVVADESNSACHTAWCNTLIYNDPNNTVGFEGISYTTNQLSSPTVAPALPFVGDAAIYLSDIPYTGTTSGGSKPAQNADYKGTANSEIHSKSGITFQKGFGTHPKAKGNASPSYIEIDVSAYQIRSFYAVLTRTANAASNADIPVYGQIWVDYGNGYRLFLETARITNADMLEIHITDQLEGAKKIKLVTIADSTSNTSSHTAWCNAMVYNAPSFVGTQYKAAENGCYDARLVFTVDSLAWESLNVSLTHNGKTKTESITTVYSTLLADYSSLGGKSNAKLSANDLGNTYVFVVCITGIPASMGAVDFDITLTATNVNGQSQISSYTVWLNA